MYEVKFVDGTVITIDGVSEDVAVAIIHAAYEAWKEAKDS